MSNYSTTLCRYLSHNCCRSVIGGETYHTSNLLNANEVSVAELQRTGQILLNGRCGNHSWCSRSCKASDGACNNRTRYVSTDGGEHFGDGTPSTLLDDGSGCARSLLSIDDVLYSAEPQGPHRSQMLLQCSRDSGKSWLSQLPVNGNGPGGYSALVGPLKDVSGRESMLMVWEHGGSGAGDDGNHYFGVIGTEWCKTF
eukprot:COSAG01_NODE_11753_length_1866_cov_1.496321_1_plen_198_part_00